MRVNSWWWLIQMTPLKASTLALSDSSPPGWRGGCRGWQVAVDHLQEALSIYRDIGSIGGEVTVLNEAGALSRERGDLGEARSRHQQALDLARAIDSSWDEVNALAGLGRYALADDGTAEGEAGLRRALMIFQRIGSAEAAGVSAELDALSGLGQGRSMV